MARSQYVYAVFELPHYGAPEALFTVKSEAQGYIAQSLSNDKHLTDFTVYRYQDGPRYGLPRVVHRYDIAEFMQQ